MKVERLLWSHAGLQKLQAQFAIHWIRGRLVRNDTDATLDVNGTITRRECLRLDTHTEFACFCITRDDREGAEIIGVVILRKSDGCP